MSAIEFDERGFRYRPLVKLASGGMATVYLGALSGPAGFRQIVAIKRPHAHLLEHAETREAALAEARIAARFRHANVVDVRDVEVSGDSIQLVMDYIEGATLSTLLAAFARRGERIPVPIAMRILLDACAGLSAVHELTDDAGAPLHVVHRDISPQNILVGVDGVARVSDFGTVKEPASERPLTTQGTLKGKPGYMAPEYVQRGALDARSDELSLAVVAWETLAGKRLFRGATDFDTFERVLRSKPPAPSEEVPSLGTAFDEPLGRALSKDPDGRYATVRQLADALARAWPEVATCAAVGELVMSVAGDELRARRAELREKLEAMDAATASGPPSIDVVSAAPEQTVTVVAQAAAPSVEPTRTIEAAPIAAAPLPAASARTSAPWSRRRIGIASGLVLSVVAILVGGIFLRARGVSGELDRASGFGSPPLPAGSATASSVSHDLSAEDPGSTPHSGETVNDGTGGDPLGSQTSAQATALATIPAPSPSASARGAPRASGMATTSAATTSAASTAKRGPKPPPPNPY